MFVLFPGADLFLSYPNMNEARVTQFKSAADSLTRAASSNITPLNLHPCPKIRIYQLDPALLTPKPYDSPLF